jgi:hypothetical protein
MKYSALTGYENKRRGLVLSAFVSWSLVAELELMTDELAASFSEFSALAGDLCRVPALGNHLPSIFDT